MISTASHLEIEDLRSQFINGSLVSINIALMDLVNKFSFVQEQNLAYLNSLSTGGAQKFVKKFNEDPEIQRRLQSFEVTKTSNALTSSLSQIQLNRIHSAPGASMDIKHCEESLFKVRRLNSGKQLLRIDTSLESTSETDVSDISSQFTGKSQESPKTFKPSVKAPQKSFRISQSIKSNSRGNRASNIAHKTLEGLGPFKFFKKSTDYRM